jgi:hypothetical protein
MDVVIEWRELKDGDDGWYADCALYAYRMVCGAKILYIGKVDDTTVQRRWNRSGKEQFWDELPHQRGIYEHVVLLGEIALARGCRLTRELVADVKSLLIKWLRHWGNIQCLNSRISRPGLRVMWKGDWPAARTEFRDIWQEPADPTDNDGD